MRRWFRPILAGATPADRLRACIAAGVALAAVGLLGALVHGDGEAAPWIVAPIGASAALVFAVPTSPMSQPWPVIGGNALSALVGVAVGHAIGHGTFACALAAALAIAVMSGTRSLHPPGGAAAMVAVLGGAVVDDAGWWFPLAPVALNAVVLVALGWVFHRLVGHHDYPHVHPVGIPAPTTEPPRELSAEQVDVVLSEIGETFDISPEDLQGLVARLTRAGDRVGA